MYKFVYVTFFAVLLMTGNCWAADFSLVLNDDSVQGVLSKTFNSNELGESILGGRLLYSDDKDTLLGSVNVGVRGAPGNIAGLKLGAQVNGNWGRSNKKDLLAFGLGVSSSYQLPQLHGLGVYGRLQYAPKLLSFMDSERMWETAVGVNYAFNPKAMLVVEYQNIEVDFEGTRTLHIDESVRAGIQFYF